MPRNTRYQDGTYLQCNPTWHAEDSPWKARHIATILRRNHISPKTVCEIGCGAGEVLSGVARELGDDVVCSGFEVSPQAFEICRTKEQRNLRFFLRDPLDEPEPVFDVALAIDVVEHVEDCFGFLRRLKRKAVYKVLHIPLEMTVQAVLRMSPLLAARASVGHIHYFSRETAIAILEDTGYELIDQCYTALSLELPARGWARLARLPRRLAFAAHPDFAVRVLGGFWLLVLAK